VDGKNSVEGPEEISASFGVPDLSIMEPPCGSVAALSPVAGGMGANAFMRTCEIVVDIVLVDSREGAAAVLAGAPLASGPI
jgi:hypothetical protein